MGLLIKNVYLMTYLKVRQEKYIKTNLKTNSLSLKKEPPGGRIPEPHLIEEQFVTLRTDQKVAT